MRKINLDRAKSGYCTAKNIHSLDGVILLKAGTLLTDDIIEQLSKYHITELYIDDDLSKGIQITETIKQEIIVDIKSKVRTLMRSPSIRIAVNTQKALKIVETLLDEILKNDFITMNLCDIRSIDDYTYSHSVNVAIFSLITGVAIGLKKSHLKELGIGALLHDVGKVMVDDSILRKPTNLTVNEYDKVKKHTLYGYEILKKSKSIPEAACCIALYHHERTNGSGYPYSLKNNVIPLQAKIVAIADVYDALTSDRMYRRKMYPHEVVDYMCSLSQKHFDKTLLDAFTSHISNYPVGIAVKLNSGEKGIVARYNRGFQNKPIIHVVTDKNGVKLENPKEVNLLMSPEIRIVDIWDI